MWRSIQKDWMLQRQKEEIFKGHERAVVSGPLQGEGIQWSESGLEKLGYLPARVRFT